MTALCVAIDPGVSSHPNQIVAEASTALRPARPFPIYTRRGRMWHRLSMAVLGRKLLEDLTGSLIESNRHAAHFFHRRRPPSPGPRPVPSPRSPRPTQDGGSLA